MAMTWQSATATSISNAPSLTADRLRTTFQAPRGGIQVEAARLVVTIMRGWKTKGLIALVIAGTLFACSPRIENRGNSVDLDNLTELVPGETSKARVSALLGAPSSTSDFGTDTWFYIASKTKTVAFFNEELISRQVVYIGFDGTGVVDSVGLLDEKDGKRVEYVNRETPTAGQRITFLQQLIGNIGRFNEGGN